MSFWDEIQARLSLAGESCWVGLDSDLNTKSARLTRGKGVPNENETDKVLRRGVEACLKELGHVGPTVSRERSS